MINDDSIYFYHKNIRWYHDLDSVMSFVDIDDELCCGDFKFVRMGQEPGDIEIDGCYHDGVVDIHPYHDVEIIEKNKIMEQVNGHKFIVTETIDPDFLNISVDEYGLLLIFDNHKDAEKEADICHDSIIVTI